MAEEEKNLKTEVDVKEPTKTNFDDLLENPFGEAVKNPLAPSAENKAAKKEKVERAYDNLPPERQEQAQKLSKEIDVNDMDGVVNYGAVAQQKIGDFSHNVLNHVKNSDTGHIGESINDLMFRLKESNPDDLYEENTNVFKRLFRKVNRSIYETTAKYQKIGAQVDKIAAKLDKEKDGLLKDNEMLSDLYDQNLEYHQILNVYIAAGELRMEELQNEIIPEAMKKAEQSNDQMDVQRVNDLNQFLNRLDKRVHDLKIARQMTIQQAPQIRLIQNTNQTLSEKIQTSINTAIPLWKNQIVIALTLLRQRDAVAAQKQVSDTTNEMLTKNSEMLKQSSIETAHENERAVIDIETLEKTQSDLIETLEETLSIQEEGRLKRRDAERRLSSMEDRLRDQLLELTGRSDK